MADYIYLLQNRLSPAQQTALQTIRDVARTHGLTVFLVGGAVRDLTSGSPVHDLDVAVQGNALKLKKDIELAGAALSGEVATWQVIFAVFPGGVRVEIGSTLSMTYPKPGKPVAQPATILDDLRRRDFTANAMALSLNDGSYGLLMDPLNGVADIENRQLRLVSNYGFIEEPVRMIRAARFSARLGWTMDDKTLQRYETGKTEKYISALSNTHRGYETEEIFHEEDPLRVLRKLEEEGWMKHLFPALTAAKANVAELDRLREVQTQLQVSGIHPDPAAANFPLLTAKLSATELAELKKSFVRQGFVREIESLDAGAKEFAARLSGKGAALPSQTWALIHAAKPEAVLWTAYSSKNPAIQAKLKSFHTEWPKARQKVPFALMQEMRIVPELDRFNEVVEKVFFELMDGNLTAPEEQKAFLEPFSPPAPPPPVRLGRSRAGKKDSKAAKGKKKLAEVVDEDEDDLDRDLDADSSSADEREDIKTPLDDEDEDEAVIPVVDIDDPVESSVPEADEEPEVEAQQVPEDKSAVVTSKPKRVRTTPAKAVPPADPVVAVIPSIAKRPPTPAKNAVPVNVPTKAAAKAEAPVVLVKAPAGPVKTAAKKTVVPVPARVVKKIEPTPAPAKKTAAKQVPPAKKAATTVKAKAFATPPPPAKTAAKKITNKKR